MVTRHFESQLKMLQKKPPIDVAVHVNRILKITLYSEKISVNVSLMICLWWFGKILKIWGWQPFTNWQRGCSLDRGWLWRGRSSWFERKTSVNEFYQFCHSYDLLRFGSRGVYYTLYSRKHCQRHNGPEGWVHITTSQFTALKSWTSYNFIISIKH